MWKSFGSAMASTARCAAAVAAMRQSACQSVTARAAYDRRQSPARQPASTVIGSMKRPLTRCSAALRPGQSVHLADDGVVELYVQTIAPRRAPQIAVAGDLARISRRCGPEGGSIRCWTPRGAGVVRWPSRPACGALSPGVLGDTPGGSTTRCRWVAQPASCGSAGTIPGWADEVREVVGEPVALAPSNSPLRLAPSAPRTQGCFEYATVCFPGLGSAREVRADPDRP